MARYYNRTAGLLTVVLKDGSSVVVPSKQYLDVAPEQDGSSSLRTRESKGLLVKVPEAPSVEVSGSSESEPAIEPEPEPAPEPVPEPEPEPESEEERPSMDWLKSDLAAHAEQLGLDVTGMSKAEILEAIEGTA